MIEQPSDNRGRRRRGVRFVSAALALVAILLFSTGVLRLGLPSFSNPFGTKTVDRSGPVLLLKLTDLARFEAASGTFREIVDVEKDVDNVPSMLAGERALFVAQASVDAYVDFSRLDEGAITVSADGQRVDVTLPPAALSDVRVDPEQSYVFSRDRGVLNRLGGVFSDNPTSERELYLAAERKIAEAAEDSGLRERAEDNTRSMLTGMLATLGYTNVGVQFSPDVRP